MLNRNTLNLSWEQFEANHPDKQNAFERLSLSIFRQRFIDCNEILHSEPNNPGVEVLPVKSKDGKSKISFQAKYFESKISYSQIKDSMKKVVNYYKNRVDIVYLFCNKDITTTSKSYEEISEFLKDNGIRLIPITGQSLLEYIDDYNETKFTYFGVHSFDKEWFDENLQLSLIELGKRYNSRFNIELDINKQLDLFLRREGIAKVLNEKKHNIQEYICKLKKECKGNEYSYLIRIENEINSLIDVQNQFLFEAEEWEDKLLENCNDVFDSLKIDLDDLENKIKDIEISNVEKGQLSIQLNCIKAILHIPSYLRLSEIEKSLINNSILIITGEKGEGKSQLLATSSKKYSDSNQLVLLSLGHTYMINENIDEQLIKHLIGGNSNYSFEELLGYMNEYAKSHFTYSAIIIDAINESSYKNIWKNGIDRFFSIIRKYDRIRLVLSLRSDLERLCLSDKVLDQIDEGSIAYLRHTGFIQEDIDTIYDFLSNYNIPISPEYCLKSQMANPLYLTWFCENYTEGNIEFLSLIKKVIEHADVEAAKAIDCEEPLKCTEDILLEIAKFKQENNLVSRDDLLKLSCWNLYGIDKKIQYITSLEKSGLITSYELDNQEYYIFAYDLLREYCIAKYIIKENSSKKSFKEYCLEKLFGINDRGEICCSGNDSIFVMAAALFALRNKQESFDIIDSLPDNNKRLCLINEYMKSFCWRKSYIDLVEFFERIKKYKVSLNYIWPIFIENALSSNSVFNSDGLTKILSKYPLNKRDYFWSIFINESDATSRIINYIRYIEEGHNIGLSIDDTLHLLTLLSWTLSSSNRVFRDRVSKAMIELFKENINFCKTILSKFEKVNDPYIIQRLYGIVLGAVLKRKESDYGAFKELVQYIYKTIFDKEIIYPDILLRDYARLIIERFIYEYPNEGIDFETHIFRPPYKSNPIPISDEEDYSNFKYHQGGIGNICKSMKFDLDVKGIGFYGDFGRYKFQAALNDFIDIDYKNIYYYSLKFIFEKLGYNESLFGKYDNNVVSGGRHHTKRIERIGKKYQWIAFYNILSRISDYHRVKNFYKSDDKKGEVFNGTWNPYVRDFDPTLNSRIKPDSNIIPIIQLKGSIVDEAEFINPLANDNQINKWKSLKPILIDYTTNNLLQKDTNGYEWIVLYSSNCLKKEVYSTKTCGKERGNQEVWSQVLLYFTEKKKGVSFTKDIIKKYNMGATYRNSYWLYNREYSWSPGFIDTYTNNDNEFRESVIRYCWEEQYDASNDDTVSFFIPCGKIISDMHLYQKDIDGLFYYQDELVAFDKTLINECESVFYLRKDIFDEFLKMNKLHAIWVVKGHKDFALGNYNYIHSDWSGIMVYEKGHINGEITID